MELGTLTISIVILQATGRKYGLMEITIGGFLWWLLCAVALSEVSYIAFSLPKQGLRSMTYGHGSSGFIEISSMTDAQEWTLTNIRDTPI